MTMYGPYKVMRGKRGGRQITVPSQVREALRLPDGGLAVWIVRGKRVTLKRATT